MKTLQPSVLLFFSIAVAHLAAKLKVTTNSIKNVYIWGLTCPDVHYATVLMHPPRDYGSNKKVDISVATALNDDHWLRGEFVEVG